MISPLQFWHISGARVVNIKEWPMRTEQQARTLASSLGEHTDETLRDLGYSQEKINELRQKGVIS